MKRSVVSLLAVLLLSTAAPAALIIDNFNEKNATTSSDVSFLVRDPTLAPVIPSSSTTVTGITVFNTIGGERYYFVEKDGGTGAIEADVNVAGRASVSIADTTLGHGGFLWDGGGSLGANLSNYSFIRFQLYSFNAGSGTPSGVSPSGATPPAGTSVVLTLRLTDDSLNSEEQYMYLGPGTSTGTKYFNLGGFSGVNLANISSIALDFNALNESPDFSIDNVEADTPEPATYAMLGAGLVGLAILRRRAAK